MGNNKKWLLWLSKRLYEKAWDFDPFNFEIYDENGKQYDNKRGLLRHLYSLKKAGDIKKALAFTVDCWHCFRIENDKTAEDGRRFWQLWKYTPRN